jgi:sugar phosphate isomerase/epimerase
VSGEPRFSVIDSTTPHLPLAEALEIYSRVGATGVGITEERLGDIAEAAARVAASGLEVSGCFLSCSSILPPSDPANAGPGRPELAEPEQRIAAMAESMRRLAPLRPGFYYALSGPLGRHSADSARSLVIDGLRELARVAAELDAAVALELFHPSLAEWSYASTIDEGIDILRAVDRPNAALAVDVWHLDRTPLTLAQLRAHADRIATVHIDDWREPTRGARDRVLPGDGAADIPGILASVDAGGFSGWYELEILSDDGTYGDDYPDSLWKRDPFELVSEGHAKFIDTWNARFDTGRSQA